MEPDTTQEKGTEGRRKELVTIGAIALLAFALRLAYVVGAADNPHYDRPIMDAAYHLEWARALAAGESFQGGEPFFRAPLYVWFLAACLKLSGGSLVAVRIVQCVLGALTAALTYRIGRQAYDRRTGIVAGVAAATYWVLIYFDGELLIPALLIPLLLLALDRTLALRTSPTPRAALVAGLAYGIAAIARPNVLLFVPVVALWLLAFLRREGRAVPRVLVFAVGVLTPILPLTAYNAFAAKDAVLISSQAGVNFWIGNNPDSDGSTAIVPGTRGGWWEGYHDAIAMAEAAEGRALRPSGVSRHYSGRAWDWMTGEPLAAVRHLLWKLRLFVTDWELGNNQEVRFFAHRFSALPRFLPLGFAVALGFGLLGMILAVRRRSVMPLVGFVVVYTASVVLFFVNSRFRLPVLPVLFVFGGHALFWLVDRIRAREVGAAAAGGLLVVAAAVGSSVVPAGVLTDDANGYLQLGRAELARGDTGRAEHFLRRAVELHPRNVFALTSLAGVLIVAEDYAEAERHLETALKVAPDKLDALDVLLDLYVRTGRPAECVARCEREIRERPHLAVPRYHLGRLRFAEGNLSEAARLFDEASARDPRDFRSAYALGLARKQLGELDAAIQAFQRAVANVARAEPPFDDLAHRELAALRARAN